jgi:hypothetical protein
MDLVFATSNAANGMAVSLEAMQCRNTTVTTAVSPVHCLTEAVVLLQLKDLLHVGIGVPQSMLCICVHAAVPCPGG